MTVFTNSDVKFRGPSAMRTLVPFLISFCIKTPIFFFVMLPIVIISKIYGMVFGLCCRSKRTISSVNETKYTEPISKVTSRSDRKYDAVVYGATGYTGGLLAKYFAKTYGLNKKLKWAIGGRSQAKLEEVRDQLTTIDPQMKDLDIVIANSNSFIELAQMCNDTKVVMSTVGPYTLYGTVLVNACAVYGTDYTDITGELDWVRKNVVEFQDLAIKSGARIISFCGHDSIPWDLAAFMIADKLKTEHNQSMSSVTFWDNISSKPSGGTIATVFELYERRQNNTERPVRIAREEDVFFKPPGAKKGNGFTSKNLNTKMLSYDKKAGSWAGIFFMADPNQKIVDRSNSLVGYGDKMKYNEKIVFPGFMFGYMYYLDLIYMGCALNSKLLGGLFRRYILPKQGEGSSDEDLQKGFLNLYGEGVGNQGERVNCVMTWDKDPGYLETARMIGESGLCFVFNNDELKLGGGMHTTASGLGKVLLKRLMDTGTGFNFYNPRAEKLKSK